MAVPMASGLWFVALTVASKQAALFFHWCVLLSIVKCIIIKTHGLTSLLYGYDEVLKVLIFFYLYLSF